MRIARLHLRAYGHFTDYSLDFGSEPGLHVIYGENETGKSTTLRALSSILFGYPHEVVDGFKHDPKDIAIAADLIASDGSKLSYVRKRRGKNVLANASGTPLDESTVASYLGGASRDLFEKVFALDYRRLQKHGQSLLAEGGSLGFSLAEAGSGIAGLKAVLDGFKNERNILFLAGGSKPKLNQLISKLIDLRKDARRRTVSLHDYAKRQKDIEHKETDLQNAREKKKTTQADIRRLERIAKNLPLRAEHQALSRKIEELRHIPVLLPEITQQRIKAQTDCNSATEDLQSANTAIEALELQVADIVVDELTLGRSQDIERLAERRAVIENTERDLPKREAERAQHCDAARSLLAQAELAGDPENLGSLLPSALKRRAISALAGAGAKLIAQQTTATESAEKAAEALTIAEERAAQAPNLLNADELARTLISADKLGDISSQISKRSRGLDRKTKALTETIVSLGITDRSAARLRELVIPPAKTVARYQELFAAVDKEIAASNLTIEGLQEDSIGLEDNIAALKTSGDVATEDELGAVRSIRKEGWVLVRGLYIDKQPGFDVRAKAFAPNGRLADVYEEHVNTADHISDVIRAHTAEATELSLLARRKVEIAKKISERQGQAMALASRRTALLAEWQALWPADTVSLQLPGEMLEWLKRRDAALAEAEALDEERDDIAELANNERDKLSLLVDVLKDFSPVKPEDGLEKLREHARQILGDITKANDRHTKAIDAVRTRTADKTQAQKTADKLQAQITEWTKQWGAKLAEVQLDSNLSTESVAVILDFMGDLDGLKLQIDDLAHRIETMKEDCATFKQAIEGLVTFLSGESASGPVEACRRLEAKLGAAKSAQTSLNGSKAELNIRSAAKDQAQEKLRLSKMALERLCDQADCTTPEELAEIERKSAEKQQAWSDRGRLETRIREDGPGFDVETLFAECEGVIGDQIPAEISLLKADGDEIDVQVEHLMSDRATLNHEFEGLFAQNQAADLTQEAANVEAEIADIVEAYVDLTVQEAVLRQAIDLYRDRNQGPILTRAKGLFAELTDSVYTGLRADIDEKGEPVLIAEHRDRGSLEVAALSDGTVDPLYLALRLAVVQEHNSTREPLPFVADDLLLNLDNTRAQSAFRTLTQIAGSTQVLFFTHHAHMVDLARAVVPETILREHRLPAVV